MHSACFRRPDINQGVTDFHNTPGSLLLDVRNLTEYRQGHIPGSRSLPLHSIECIDEVADHPDVPLFVYCQSGARSRQAVLQLQELGYTNAINIGGISCYSGAVVSGCATA